MPKEGSSYCSQYCANANDTVDIDCNCGHEDCAFGVAVGLTEMEECA
jgi:hypothetical protein